MRSLWTLSMSDAQHARGFAGMRRGQRRCAARLGRGEQRGVARDQVERVGVERDGDRQAPARAAAANARHRWCPGRDRRPAHPAARRAPRRRVAASIPACWASIFGGSAIRKPSQTLPAPVRIAARPARISAPPMPSVPPRMPSVPNVPLLTLRERRASTAGSVAASAAQSRRWPLGGEGSSSPSVCTEIAPQ